MPTYEYACRSCGEHQDVVQSFTDDPLTTCPACGGELRKVYGNVGIVFKGNGFYKTDSRTTTKGGTNGSSGGDAQKAPAEATSTSSESPKSGEAAAGASKDGGASGSSATPSTSTSGSGSSSTTPAKSVPAAT